MPSSEEDQVFTDEEIGDTTNHNSVESISGVFKAKTIFIINGLNQSVTFQLQGARDSVWIDKGGTFDVPANTNTHQTVDTYFPKYRLQAACGTSPTTGVLDVWIIKAV